MKKTKIFIIIAIMFCLTGCYNYRELNQLAITSAIGINKKGDDYELIIQVINTQKQGSDGSTSSDQPKFVIYKTKGRTIQEAVRNIIIESPKRLYVNHISLLIISEEIAKDEIDDIIDIFARDSEFRKQFMVVISKKDKTEDVMDVLTNLETLNAKNIKDSIVTDSKYLGSSAVIHFEDFLEMYLNDKIDLVLPSITMKGNSKKGSESDNIKESEPDATVILNNLAVFKDNKLVGYLNKQDSINVNIIKNKINNTIYTYECKKDKYVSIEIINSKTDINSNENALKINVKQQANINEINCDINLEKKEDIEKLEKDIGKSMKKSLLKTINNTIQKYDADIFGFKDIIYKNNPNNYKNLVKEFDKDLLQNLNFEVKVDLNLYDKGNILKEI